MSGADWSTIYADDKKIRSEGQPVKAHEATFEATALLSENAAESAEWIRSQFVDMTNYGGASQFSGDAAQALATTMVDLSKSLKDVGPIFSDLAGALRTHADTLARLRRDAADALARARTAWHERNAAAAEESAASAEASDLASQMASVEARVAGWRREMDALPADPTDASRIIYSQKIAEAQAQANATQRWLDNVRSRQQQAAERRQRNEGILEQIRIGDGPRSWHGLHDAETDLNVRTARRVDSIQLGSLKDPNILQRAVSAVADWATALADIRHVFGALLEGDVERALGYVRDFLGAIAIALVIIVAVVLIVQTGGAFLAASGPLLAKAKTASIVMKFAVSTKGTTMTHLATTIHANSTLGVANLALDGTSLAVRALDGNATGADAAKYAVQFISKGFGSALESVVPFTELISHVLPADSLVERVFSSEIDARMPADHQIIQLDQPISHDIKPPNELIDLQRSSVQSSSPSDLGASTPRFCIRVGGGGR